MSDLSTHIQPNECSNRPESVSKNPLPLVNILICYQSMKAKHFINALNYTCVNVTQYRTTLSILLGLSVCKRFILRDIIRMFSCRGQAARAILKTLFQYGYITTVVTKRQTNLPAFSEFTGYKITPEGRKAVKRFELELQAILDKSTK